MVTNITAAWWICLGLSKAQVKRSGLDLLLFLVAGKACDYQGEKGNTQTLRRTFLFQWVDQRLCSHSAV